jgi:beta-galactosidase
VQHNSSPSRAVTTFSANLNTSAGIINVPNITLNGRQSKIIVTDYHFGNNNLLYSSSDVLTYGVFDRDVLVLYLEEGQVGQFALQNISTDSKFDTHGTSTVEATSRTGDATTFVYTQSSGKTVVQINDILIYLLERETAWKFWAPTTTLNPRVTPDEQIFVIGPYLVRNAYISHGVAHVSGDNDVATTIEIYSGQPSIETIVWNGIRLPATKYASLRSFTNAFM